VPATVKMQIQAGLQAYLPSVPAGLPDKPDAVPDETAILFWESQATYWNGFSTLAVRTYTLTHNGVYITENHKSGADFPVVFAGPLPLNKPVFLYETPADWMHGKVTHLVAAQPTSVDAATFATNVAGAIACLGDQYVVYWELVPSLPGGPQPPSGIPILQEVVGWSRVLTPAPTFLPLELWDVWAGMDVQSGSSFNMQFERR
jgi:hypothetical protein